MTGELITLPTAWLAPYAPLPADSTVVLARSLFHTSPYADQSTRTGWHIVNWLLPATALCRTEVVDVRAPHGRVAPLDGRDDARYGRPVQATCAACSAAFAGSTRECLPGRIQEPMEMQDRAARAARREARELERAAAVEAVEQRDGAQLFLF